LLHNLFGTGKPIIAMLHARALPGRPRHDAPAGMKPILDALARDLDTLQAAGVDGLLFCNEADLPYRLQTGPETAAAMAALVGELNQEIHVPFGIDIVWDPVASLAVARATGACFVREVFTGVYESDLGLMRPGIGAGAEDVAVFANVTPEFASPLGHRTTAERARGAAFLGADAILITGPVTGMPTSLEELQAVKAAVPGTPVLASTGVTVGTIKRTLETADGAIVGTHLKHDGVTWNPVDPVRAAAFMAAAHSARSEMAV
ncbi:MAG TPA: BtpA/SgcQ family protein, partial [Streptosporangiaceae bacterium]|nr:BtpA/SgcQ family protein [Streptosporangiaceae bacterium]